MIAFKYKQLYNVDDTGIAIKYYTERGYYTSPHWHSPLELIFVLKRFCRDEHQMDTDISLFREILS